MKHCKCRYCLVCVRYALTLLIKTYGRRKFASSSLEIPTFSRESQCSQLKEDCTSKLSGNYLYVHICYLPLKSINQRPLFSFSKPIYNKHVAFSAYYKSLSYQEHGYCTSHHNCDQVSEEFTS